MGKALMMMGGGMGGAGGVTPTAPMKAPGMGGGMMPPSGMAVGGMAGKPNPMGLGGVLGQALKDRTMNHRGAQMMGSMMGGHPGGMPPDPNDPSQDKLTQVLMQLLGGRR